MKSIKHIYNYDLPHRAVSVYIYLCGRADKNGTSYPSIRRIASDLSLSRATVKRAIKDLEEADLLTKENRFRDNGGKSSNLYGVKK